MKTTQKKAIAAFATLTVMGQKPMDSLTAYKLFKLKKALTDVVEFRTQQEMKLVEKHGGTVTETGQVRIEDENARKEYAKDYRELEQLECEVNVERVEMSLQNFPQMTIQEIESLEPFINFEGGQ